MAESDARYRPATLVECLVAIKARLSDHLSPAEQRELQQAIEYIGNDDEPMDAPRSERGPSAEAARIARKVLDEKGLYNITTEEMVLAREILRLASPAER